MARMLALALLAPSAMAQERTAAAMLSIEIIGIAPLQGLGIDRRLLPYPVQSASERQLRKAGGDNLAEFMARNLNGVNVNEVSGSPFQNDLTFRGFRASPVLGTSQGISVYLDGVRVNEPFGDVVNWDMLPEAAISNLLLVPGSNPLYGLNTLGGALALQTRSGLTSPGADVEMSLGANGRKRADLAFGTRGENGWHSFIGATLFDEEGWRDHSDGRLANALVKVGRSAGADAWSATLLAGRSRLLGNGLLPDPLYEDDRRAVYTHPDTTRNRLAQGTLNYTRKLPEGGELALTAYARDSRRDTVNGDIGEDYDDYVEDCEDGFSADGEADDPDACGVTRGEGAAIHPGVLNTTSTRQRGQGFSAAFSALRGAHRIDAGATFDRASVGYAQFEQEAFIDGSREVIADDDEQPEPSASVTGRSRAFGLYIADSWALGPATQLTVSARFNHARVGNTLTNERGVQPAEAFTYKKLNPSLGIAHALGPGTSLFANIAQGNRVPTVIELGCADPEHPCRLPVGLQADPYLKQVVARSMEFGVRGNVSGGSYAVSLHRTANRDDILFLSSGPSRQGYFSNFARTRHQGIDASFARQYGKVDVRASYSYLEAVYDADGELFTGARNVQVERGTRIAGMPRHTGKLGVDWKVGHGLVLGADLHGVSSIVSQGNEDGLVEDAEEGEPQERADWRVRGYGLLGLRARFVLNGRWELFARVSNVLDRRYETYGAVAPDLFPSGRLLAPHDGPVDAEHARFVAPGAPRSFVVGVRYAF
ncbi:TonB-dependent receptor [Massilia cavernae]|uniref:TonB-dependent receptor n=2 Tax=Massilia cavernae TaxID=2320864 RepID=A0A418XFE6_9BURK|nr:TonB-dependent receptor [Massilia cavernae]